MSSDGPGIAHNLASWLYWKEISNAQTDADQEWIVGKERLLIWLESYPHLRPKAAKLVNDGVTDPRDIVAHFICDGDIPLEP